MCEMSSVNAVNQCSSVSVSLKTGLNNNSETIKLSVYLRLFHNLRLQTNYSNLNNSTYNCFAVAHCKQERQV